MLFNSLFKKDNNLDFSNCYLVKEGENILPAKIEFELKYKLNSNENPYLIRIITENSEKILDVSNLEKVIFERQKDYTFDNILKFVPKKDYIIKFSSVDSFIHKERYNQIREKFESIFNQ